MMRFFIFLCFLLWAVNGVCQTDCPVVAEMKIELQDTFYSKYSGVAPVKVSFKDQSTYAQKWEWYLYKKTEDLIGQPTLEDSLLMSSNADTTFTYTYEDWGEYRVRLIVENVDSACKDTTERLIRSYFDPPVTMRITDVLEEPVKSSYRSETDSADIDFYAIKDTSGSAPFGKIVFTPGGGGGWEYEWSYNGVVQSNEYSSDSSSMTVGILGDGLYVFKVHHNGHGGLFLSDSMQFYVFFDHLELNIDFDPDDIYNCEQITIDIANFTPPEYNGVFSGGADPEYTVVWDGGERVLVTPPGGGYEYWQLAQSVEKLDHNVTCKIKLKDKFGVEWESNEVEYVSVIPTAKMTFELVDPLAENTGEAPQEVHFTDESVNAQKWEWYLYKDTADLQTVNAVFPEDSLVDEQVRISQHVDYTYMHPGYYGVKLIATNTNGPEYCTDTTELEYITVYYSLVDVPNVFTPNGDGINDVFRVKAYSLETFQGIILNRWERKVFEWHNPDDGWDGKIDGKNAGPGTYYYIIKAKGREKNSPPKYIKKGALLLVR